jgi:nucleoside-diphosphate-sugar epimerase
MVNPPPEEPLGGFSGNLVDVRDVALGHVLALEQEHAGGQRYITSNGRFTWNSFRANQFFRFSRQLLSGVCAHFMSDRYSFILL